VLSQKNAPQPEHFFDNHYKTAQSIEPCRACRWFSEEMQGVRLGNSCVEEKYRGLPTSGENGEKKEDKLS
jgi:hypothetical protein